MSDYLIRSNNYDKEISVDTKYSQHQGNRGFYHQNDSERKEWHHDNGSPTTVTTEDGNSSFFGELEKILSTQIQILNIIKQKKVKGSCGMNKRQQNEPKAKCVAEKTTTNKNAIACVPSAGIDGRENCGTIIEHNNNFQMDENTFMFNYPPNVPQPVQHCKETPEMHRGCANEQLQFINMEEQTNEKILQKKAAHNRIEKRRRSFINDKIAELKNLLPEEVNRNSCTNKGSILQESVDYIKKLQSNFAVMKQLQERIKEIDFESKQNAMRLEMLEKRTRENIVNTKSLNVDQKISPALEGATNLSFDSEENDCLPELMPNMSNTMNLEDVLDTFSLTFEDS